MDCTVETLSKKSKRIIAKISAFLKGPGRHPLIKDLGNGVLEENYTKYDLKTQAGRDAWIKQCSAAVSFAVMIQARRHLRKNSRHGMRGCSLSCTLLDPWVTLIFLTERLDFQIETGDLMD